jgi:GNAT superfamily N-acetyltransferase
MMNVDTPTLMSRVRETLRVEGPVGLIGRVLCRVARAFVCVEHVDFYDHNLSAAPVGTRPSRIDLRCQVASRDDLLEIYRPALDADFGLDADELKRRIARSHLALLGIHQDAVVGIVWLAFNYQAVSEIGRTIVLRPGEVLTYNGFTLPKWRGCGISPALSQFASQVARHRGATRRINWRRVNNGPAVRVAVKLRDRFFARVTTVRVLGVSQALVFGLNSTALRPLLQSASPTPLQPI